MGNKRMHTVHVVSADGALRDALGGALRDLGHRVEAFARVDEYRRVQAGPPPDCLMLDPGLAEALTSRPQLGLRGAVVRAPVICVAIAASAATVVRAMRSGALDFLCVPFDRDDLARAL